MFKNMIKSAALAFGALALMTSAAFASDGTTAGVTGGSLTITNPAASIFAGKNITGVAQTTNADLDAFSVSDLRGTGAGWHVTAEASTFTRTPTGHNLDASSLKMSRPTATANGTTSPAPTIPGTLPFTIDNGAVTIASAALDEGMGTYDFSATTLTLSLPANIYAGSFASTVTITEVTAP